MKKKLFTLCSLALALAGAHLDAAPLGTAFTYQGRLTDGTNPANGTYYMVFTLHDALEGGNQVASQPTNTVSVANGLFTVDLDFGAAAFAGNARWLTINVRTNGGVGVDLAPRTRLAPAPNAIYASMAGSVRTTGLPSPGQVLSYDGNSLVWQSPATPGGAWALGGNNATGGDFLGTLNNLPMEVRVNNARVLRLEPTTGAPNVILGDGGNTVSPGVIAASIGGGTGHSIAGDHSTVAGGNGNSAGSNAAFVGGGSLNHANGSSSTLAGGYDNTVTGDYSAIGGGANNAAGGSSSSLSGGSGNSIASGFANTIAGGTANRIENAGWSSIGGGESNTNGASTSVIGGGARNKIQDHAFVSVIGGGLDNSITSWAGNSCIGGGNENTASGYYSTIPGGFRNWSNGEYSFAAGRQAKAFNNGTFVWADSTAADFVDSGANTFNVRANGGVRFQAPYLTVSGNVGIGTSTPTQALDVRDGTGAGGQGGHIHVGGTGANGDPKLIKFGDGDFVHIGENGADDTMELKATRFVFTGGGVTVPVLTITGGADLAEPFQMSDTNIPKGAVVVIDPKNAGRLKMSDGPYDKRVAGIVSGANGINPGIALHQEGLIEGGENVALTGRVYVQADAANGAIEPGDLLTSSNTRGHAMKVTDHAQAQGAILGKAMSALKEGKGMVLVLVTLQ